MKKQLLQETEIRKMMKFANIGALSNGFVDKLNETFEMHEQDEEDAEMDMGGEDAEMDMGEPAAGEGPEDMEAPMDDPPKRQRWTWVWMPVVCRPAVKKRRWPLKGLMSSKKKKYKKRCLKKLPVALHVG